MKVLIFLFNIVLGLTFLLSAFTKLYPVEFLELKIQEIVPVGQIPAAIAARLTISVEALLAFLFIFQMHLNKKLYLFTLCLITFFICINIFSLITQGNDSNCGCFGLAFELTPFQSIVKNVILIAILLFLWRTKIKHELKTNKIVRVMLFICFLALPFILNPIILNPLNSTADLKGLKLDLAKLEGHPKVKAKTFTEDLKTGKKLVAFISLSCNYCKIASTKLAQIKRANPQMPFYFIMNGDSVEMPAFFRTTHAQNIPTVHFNGGQDFLMMGGSNLPAIYWIENSIIFRRDNYLSFNLKEFREWLAKK